MAKDEDKKPEKPEAAAPTPAELQLKLDNAAGFPVLVNAAQSALGKICDGWAKVLEGIAECDKLQQSQLVAVNVAREFAANNATHSSAVELGHSALVAHSWNIIAALPKPVVDIPTAYVRQFGTDHERFVATQVALNQGTTIVAPGSSGAEINEALLSGVRPSDIQSGRRTLAVMTAEAETGAQVDAKSWFGFRAVPQ